MPLYADAVPKPQGRHELLFGIGAYCPGEHGVQAVALPAANVPGGQPTQALPLAAVPGGQSSGVHDEEPAEDVVPLAQAVHASADDSEKVLTPHCAQVSEPSSKL